MCSTCNIKNYRIDENISDILIMPLGIGGDIMICYNITNKKYFLSTGTLKSDFMIYRCPTCGRKLY